jgi:hypothetical protein
LVIRKLNRFWGEGCWFFSQVTPLWKKGGEGDFLIKENVPDDTPPSLRRGVFISSISTYLQYTFLK